MVSRCSPRYRVQLGGVCRTFQSSGVRHRRSSSSETLNNFVAVLLSPAWRFPCAMLSEAAAWHSPRTMQRYGPPGLPPADGRPAFLGNSTGDVIRNVIAAGPSRGAAVLFHNSLVACLAEAAVGRWTYAIGDALRSHGCGRQTTKMATAVDDLDR